MGIELNTSTKLYDYRHPVAAPPPFVLPTLPRIHPECTTLLSGYTRIALPPKRL
jgi:hypothetical protein